MGPRVTNVSGYVFWIVEVSRGPALLMFLDRTDHSGPPLTTLHLWIVEISALLMLYFLDCRGQSGPRIITLRFLDRRGQSSPALLALYFLDCRGQSGPRVIYVTRFGSMGQSGPCVNNV